MQDGKIVQDRLSKRLYTVEELGAGPIEDKRKHRRHTAVPLGPVGRGTMLKPLDKVPAHTQQRKKDRKTSGGTDTLARTGSPAHAREELELEKEERSEDEHSNAQCNSKIPQNPPTSRKA